MRRRTSITAMTAVPYQNCPAKTFIHPKDGNVAFGRTVFNHCQIVGHVARALLEQMPEKLIETVFPVGSELLAASHDVGKVSPTFFIKIAQASGVDPVEICPSISPFLGVKEAAWGGHAGVSSVALAAKKLDSSLQTVVAQHHGFMPSLGTRSASAEAFGGDCWQHERIKLLKALEDELQVPFPHSLSGSQVRAVSGLTSVADWIGSGPLFNDPAEPWQTLISQAVENAGYIPFKLEAGLSFKQIFGFSPNNEQLNLSKHCKKPGVYVLEAPMGVGKTEAALFCAYQALTEQQARGVYFALPTQLTSNKIHQRFNLFLQKILATDCQHRKALLLHASAWLEQSEMGEEGQAGSSWFNSKKRGLLAPFAVGTLDQALMAAMNVRHGFVRAFGLAGKVVILDEVHSYDAYTSVILDELIELLRELRCTVIILSATLSNERRKSLLNIAELPNNGYPLITALPTDKLVLPIETPLHSAVQSSVLISFVSSDSTAVEEAMLRAEQGQQVLWIENTVAEAQSRYFDFAARCAEVGVECGLLHSRYTPAHRTQNERYWLDTLGKTGWSKRRLLGRIIVGTQVLEQSIDIDADFLVSRLAPTDMLLQRVGRLWRHEQTPRPPCAKREAWVISPTSVEQLLAQPSRQLGPSASVYSPYILCRSLEVWLAMRVQKSVINLPNDMRSLIDQTYSDRQEVGALAQLKHQMLNGTPLRKGLHQLRQLARVSLSDAGRTLPDIEAQTRYSDSDSGEIILLNAIDIDQQKRVTCLSLLDGGLLELPWQRHRLTSKEWRCLSVLLMNQVVTCRYAQMPARPSLQRMKQLGFGHVMYLGHPELNDQVPFAVALAGVGGSLKGFEQQLSERYQYRYRQDIGLEIDKI